MEANQSAIFAAHGDETLLIKLELERGPRGAAAKPSLHRFRCVNDFNQLLTIVRHLATAADDGASSDGGTMVRSMQLPVVLEYVDEDGDRVRVSTPLEWSECVAQYFAVTIGTAESAAAKLPPLRLYASCTVTSVADAVPEDEAAVADAAPPAIAPRLSIPHQSVVQPPPTTESTANMVVDPVRTALQAQDAPEPTPGVDSGQNDSDLPEAGPGDDYATDSSGSGTPCTPLPDFSYEYDVPDPLESESLLGPARAGHYVLRPVLSPDGIASVQHFHVALSIAELVLMCEKGSLIDLLSEEQMGPELHDLFSRKIVSADSRTAEVAVRTKELYNRAMLLANTFMEAADSARAVALLSEVSRLRPKDPLVSYNLACAHCVAGNQELAVHFLLEAIANGYKSGPTIVAEQLFAPIREDPRFVAAVNRLNGFPEDRRYSASQHSAGPVLLEMFREPTDATQRGPARASVTQDADTQSAPPVAVVGSSHGNSHKQSVRIIERMFPELELGEASRLLRANGHNMERVVELILASRTAK